jgi:hypothetical protein
MSTSDIHTITTFYTPEYISSCARYLDLYCLAKEVIRNNVEGQPISDILQYISSCESSRIRDLMNFHQSERCMQESLIVLTYGGGRKQPVSWYRTTLPSDEDDLPSEDLMACLCDMEVDGLDEYSMDKTIDIYIHISYGLDDIYMMWFYDIYTGPEDEHIYEIHPQLFDTINDRLNYNEKSPPDCFGNIMVKDRPDFIPQNMTNQALVPVFDKMNEYIVNNINGMPRSGKLFNRMFVDIR